MSIQVFEISIILLLFSGGIIFFLRKWQLPSVLGYLFAGILAGPIGFDLIEEQENINFLAEFGIVFLLFTIGLDISLSRLWLMRSTVMLLGFLQVAFCIAIPMAVAYILGMSLEGAFVASSAIALSSTAIVIKLLQDKDELHKTYGQIVLGILVFQDIAAIPLLIVIPMLANIENNHLFYTLSFELIKGLLCALILIFIARYILKPILKHVSIDGSHELLLLFVLFAVTACAWFTNNMGMSMAFGAFMAGATLGETEFRHQLESDILPFRDILLGLFFITIGIRLNSEVIKNYWYWALWLTSAIIIFKTMFTYLVVNYFGKTEKITALKVALILAHGGEFGFALLALGMNAGVMKNDYGQVVLFGIILSMILSTIIINKHNWIIAKLKIKKNETNNQASIKEYNAINSKHVIICGFGRVGKQVADFLNIDEQKFIAIENQIEKVNNHFLDRLSVYYGDAGSYRMLENVGVSVARLLVVTFTEDKKIKKIITHARKLNPNIKILLRASDEKNAEDLITEGATVAIPETLELGLVLGSHALAMLDKPNEEIKKLVHKIREERYRLLMKNFVSNDFID